MRVRALDANLDMQFGRGQADFLANNRSAVGQNVVTRLALNVGEWFLNTAEGTPWRTQVLGMRTESTRDPALRARILSTPGVTTIAAYASQTDRQIRGYAVQASVDTIYGRSDVVLPALVGSTDVRVAR